MELTQDGMLLREQARMILALTEKAETMFNGDDEEIEGAVYIGSAETDLFRHIARVAKAVHERHPKIQFVLYAGNQEVIGGRLDRGLLDFGVMMEPADLSKYEHITLPQKDVWGLLMRKDHPLAKKETVTVHDLIGLPLFVSRQATGLEYSRNIFKDWFGSVYDELNVVGTFDLLSNTARFVEEGLGCAFSVENLIGLDMGWNLTFRPMSPPLSPKSDFVWWPFREFSPAAKVFLEETRRQLSAPNVS